MRRYKLKLTKDGKTRTRIVTAESVADAEEQLGLADDVEVEIVSSEPIESDDKDGAQGADDTGSDKGGTDSKGGSDDDDVEIISVEEVENDDSGSDNKGRDDKGGDGDNGDENGDNDREPEEPHFWYR